jgi:hypothetical protein
MRLGVERSRRDREETEHARERRAPSVEHLQSDPVPNGCR